MIVVVCEAERSRSYRLRDDQARIPVLDSHIRFISDRSGYLMRLPHNLVSDRKYEPSHDAAFRVTSTTCLRSALLIFSMYDSGYDEFEYYELPGKITIGSSIEDDIYIQTSLIQERAIILDPKGKTIEVKDDNIPASLNGKTIIDSASIQNCDILSYLNIRLILFEGVFMMNMCANVYVSSSVYKQRNFSELTADTRELRQIQFPFSPPDQQFDATIRQADRIQEREDRVLIFSLGPSLMMAFASAAAAGMNVYYGYLNGRELPEMIPMMIFPVMMILSSLIWLPAERYIDKRRRNRKQKERKEKFEQYIERVIKDTEKHYDTWRETAEKCWPSCRQLYAVMQNTFPSVILKDSGLLIRLGTSSDVVVPAFHYAGRNETDEEIRKILDRLETCREKIQPVPMIADLKQYAHICITAELKYTFYLLIQILLYYRKDYAALVLLACPDELSDWAWIYHLPQLQSSHIRRIAATEKEAGEIRDSLYEHKGTIIVIRTRKTTLHLHAENCLTLDLSRKDQYYDALIDVKEGIGSFQDFRFHRSLSFLPDPVPDEDLHALIPGSFMEYRFSGRDNGFYHLYGVTQAKDLEIAEKWRKHYANDGLQCVLGTDEQGMPVHLDLHENVHGPHGLIAGMTGSGKSELLITMILSLAVNYPPAELRIVLIDFKGGSLINAFDGDVRLPHLAGVLSNLDIDDMKRALVSIGIECRKRENLLRDMSSCCGSSVMDVSSYRSHWNKNSSLPYLPDILIVVDEFAELKRERPDFMEELISAARIGRSLGIHLILCTQKPGGIVNDQIRSNVRFRICLKVSEKQDSQELLQCDDAVYFQKAGTFALLCDGILRKGIGGYANADTASREDVTEIYDRQGKIAAENASRKKTEKTQLQETLRELCSAAADKYDYQMLWLNQLKHVPALYAGQSQGILFGRADDFYHRTFQDLCIDPGQKRTYVVFSSSVKEKESFLRGILYGYILHADSDVQLFIIDDLRISHAGTAGSVRTVIDIFSSAEKNKTDELMKYLKTTDRKQTAWLLITDYSLFCGADSKNQGLLNALLENADYLNLCIIVFAVRSKSLTYRDLQYFEERIILHSVSLSDMQEILNTAERVRTGSELSGLIRRDNVLSFVMPDIGENDLIKAAAAHMKKYGTRKSYKIPCMPENISFSDYHGDGIPLGILYGSYAWAEIGKEDPLVIICTYPEDYEGFFAYLNTLHRKIMENPDMAEESAVYLFSLAEFRKTPLQSELLRFPVLYLGEDFSDQYIFSARTRKPQEGEGILIRRRKSEVIRLVGRL